MCVRCGQVFQRECARVHGASSYVPLDGDQRQRPADTHMHTGRANELAGMYCSAKNVYRVCCGWCCCRYYIILHKCVVLLKAGFVQHRTARCVRVCCEVEHTQPFMRARSARPPKDWCAVWLSVCVCMCVCVCWAKSR